MTWAENWNMCCSLGMKPLIIETSYEQQCWSKITGQLMWGSSHLIYEYYNYAKNLKIHLFCSGMNWTLNYNYWTAGTRQGSCLGYYNWCNSPGNATLLGNLTWQSGSPKKKSGLEECIQLKLEINGGGARFRDKNCTAKFVFACQV